MTGFIRRESSTSLNLQMRIHQAEGMLFFEGHRAYRNDRQHRQVLGISSRPWPTPAEDDFTVPMVIELSLMVSPFAIRLGIEVGGVGEP